ncbi:PREDICTED: laminin subunit gamma-3 [Condylura cristata]|uniref:laminin subunit gamma-3 n=1 Tax=Condylura cristata TaxID=143302 RepID=UPI000643DF88|nr:PREDICTED: laminin subunit gamma-3 [Condylura cristata]
MGLAAQPPEEDSEAWCTQPCPRDVRPRGLTPGGQQAEGRADRLGRTERRVQQPGGHGYQDGPSSAAASGAGEGPRWWLLGAQNLARLGVPAEARQEPGGSEAAGAPGVRALPPPPPQAPRPVSPRLPGSEAFQAQATSRFLFGAQMGGQHPTCHSAPLRLLPSDAGSGRREGLCGKNALIAPGGAVPSLRAHLRPRRRPRGLAETPFGKCAGGRASRPQEGRRGRTRAEALDPRRSRTHAEAGSSHTCGSPPEDFCPHVGAPGTGTQCRRCDAADPQRHHNASYLTDFHSQDESTWWQSPSMAFGVQYPTSVNLTLRLGKAYEITYVRLKFHTSRPESFAIYRRSREGGPWQPYQFYSASCWKTYGRPEGQYLRPGEDERVAFCTSEFSDISPLSGGNVAFSTLEGRPSAYNFEGSPVLQEWVTSTELLISLDRLNTFGDDIFKDPKVLQSYYYAVADFSVGGRPCICDPAGSLGTCDPRSGRCPCKENVEGSLCDRCRPGTFNLQPLNPAGCSSCFCHGHSKVCEAAAHFRVRHILSNFRQGAEGWRASSVGPEHPARWSPGGLLLSPEEELTAPGKFLGDQRFSYGQPLTLTFWVPPEGSPPPVQLRLEGAGLALNLRHSGESGPPAAGQPGEVQLQFRLQETSEDQDVHAPLPAFHFQRLLANLTALRVLARGQSPSPSGQARLTEVRLTSAQRGLSPPASWVETCSCPEGYEGQFCESCAPGYKRETPRGGPYANCVPCTCNQHGTCDPDTGTCLCGHHTEGPSCERCSPGFYGNAFVGHADDCRPCPCPGQSACVVMPDSSEVVCTHCPLGQRGQRCEVCDDGFFGDPLGLSGPPRPCQRCQCSGNVDPNAVGNCDSLSGRCLRCLHHTTGDSCDRCREGFFGDALAPRPAHKCTPCSCNPEGSIGEQRPCDPRTGQCPCLPHVTGRDCGRCSPGFYGLRPGRGCLSCQCHPLGSQEDQCHPNTGQCPCRPGVGGQACDRCQLGFFGFSIKGCRACRCSPLGAASAQCHENSTCVCRPGFMGYKCDRCQDNFFLTAGGTRCQECPACYSLVKEETAKLKARLVLMEGWLEGSDCGRPWGPLDILQGEAPRGDVYQDHHLLQGTWEAYLEQMTGLEKAVKSAQEQLRGLRRHAPCGHAGTKACLQLADLGALLASSEEEILHAATVLKSLVMAQEGPGQPTNWSHLATEARTLARSHEDTAARVQATARRALLASNASFELLWNVLQGRAALQAQGELEDRYQEVQAAQKTLDTAVAEALTTAERALATAQRTGTDATLHLALLATPAAPHQESRTRDLGLRAQALERTVASREHTVTEAARALGASAQGLLHKTEPLVQLQQEARAALTRASSSVQAAMVTVTGARTLLADLEGLKLQFPRPKDQAVLSRKAGTVRDRLLADAEKKTKQAERMLGNAASVSSSAEKKGREAELLAKGSAKLAKAQLRRAKLEHRRASRLSAQTQATLRQASRQELTLEAHRRGLQEAEQAGARLRETERQIRESRVSLEQDIKALSELLAKLGSLDTRQAPMQALNETQQALEQLRLRLSPPGALQGKLRLLEQRSEQQELQLQDFENDLAEIRADKQNLEAILHSLPESCASWQ